MIDIRAQMLTLLKTAAGSTVAVFDQYPESEEAYPCVSFYEAENNEYRLAGGNEYLTQIAYAVDIWGETWAEIDPILHAINSAMQGLGFRREMCGDAPQPGIRHKTMRYSAILDQDGMVYQR